MCLILWILKKFQIGQLKNCGLQISSLILRSTHIILLNLKLLFLFFNSFYYHYNNILNNNDYNFYKIFFNYVLFICAYWIFIFALSGCFWVIFCAYGLQLQFQTDFIWVNDLKLPKYIHIFYQYLHGSLIYLIYGLGEFFLCILIMKCIRTNTFSFTFLVT